MKKKIDIEDTKTKVIILIISIALIIAIVSITYYHFMIKSKLPISNASKEEIEDIEEIKLPECMLYHIVYLTNNILIFDSCKKVKSSRTLINKGIESCF